MLWMKWHLMVRENVDVDVSNAIAKCNNRLLDECLSPTEQIEYCENWSNYQRVECGEHKAPWNCHFNVPTLKKRNSYFFDRPLKHDSGDEIVQQENFIDALGSKATSSFVMGYALIFEREWLRQ